MDKDEPSLAAGLALLGKRGGLGRVEEQALLLALDPSDQLLIVRRAIVIDRFLKLPKRTAKLADLAAEELGVSRSFFYRMVDRYLQAGMVNGLRPHARIKKGTESQPADPYEWVSKVIAKQLAGNPNARLKHLIEAVTLEAEQQGIKPPSATVVQRRVSGLRVAEAPSPARRDEPATFGREILIDECALDEFVCLWDPERDPAEWSRRVDRARCTFVVDVDTRLILGAGIAPARFSFDGFEGALCETDRFWSQALIGSMQPVALQRATWIVPIGMQHVAPQFVEHAERLGIEAEAVDKGARRFGERLRKLIGDHIGPYRLMPRVTPFTHSPQDLPKPELVRRPEDVAAVLALVIDDWNMEKVRAHEGAKPTIHEPTRRKRLEKWTRSRRLNPTDVHWFAQLLLPGSPVERLSPVWGVHHLRAHGLVSEEEIAQLQKKVPLWVSPTVVDID